MAFNAEEFEDPVQVAKIGLKVGAWTGASPQLLEKAEHAIVEAFNETRTEMEAWIRTNVPWQTRTLQTSGIATLAKNANRRFLPVEIWWGFPAEERYRYKTGKRKGTLSPIFKYAAFVEAKSGPGKKGGHMPFIEPGLELLKQKLKNKIGRKFGKEFNSVFNFSGLRL